MSRSVFSHSVFSRGVCSCAVAVMVAVAVMLATAALAQTGKVRNGQKTQADFEVILLGTGSPPPFMHRFGPATLVRAGGRTFLFDAGRGATQRMWQKKIRFGQGLDVLFLTHLHSDHVVGIPDVWLTGWLGGPFGRRKTPFVIMGPEGTAALGAGLMQAYAWDVKTRIEDQKLKPEGAEIRASDLTPGVVYDKDGVKVTAFATEHGKLIKPTLGYRIDFDGRSVVISGDTKYAPDLIAAAKGTDLLVHSIGAARKELLDISPLWRRIMDHHITPEDAGRVFNETRPKMAVFSHVVAATNGKIKPVPPQIMVNRTRKVYSGPLTMGKDLMVFEIEKTGVTVKEHAPKKR